MPEKQDIEWKTSWHDKYLEWICGFANAQGGKLYIGCDDDGGVTGLDDATIKDLLESLPNKCRNTMGIIPDVNLLQKGGKPYLEIDVCPYPSPISLRGRYYMRSGSMTTELTGPALEEFVLRRNGRTWDGVPVPRAGMDDLDPEAFALFRSKALQSQRLSSEDLDVTDRMLLENLRLFEGEHLRRAAVLMFAKDPESWVAGAYVKIGMFGERDSDLRYQDEIHGPLVKQVDAVLDLIYLKYMKGLIYYEDIQRVDEYLFPRDALRELLLNAIMHKDYGKPVPIQISVYEDRIYLWNPGELPEAVREARLYGKHVSYPSNPSIADAFFKTGMVECWGRGFDKVRAACEASGCPLPEDDGRSGGVGIWCHAAEKYLELLRRGSGAPLPADGESAQAGGRGAKLPEGLPSQSEAVIDYLRSAEKASSPQIAAAIGMSRSWTKEVLSALVHAGLVKVSGAGRATKYSAPTGPNRPQPAPTGSNRLQSDDRSRNQSRSAGADQGTGHPSGKEGR